MNQWVKTTEREPRGISKNLMVKMVKYSTRDATLVCYNLPLTLGKKSLDSVLPGRTFVG